MTDPSPISKIIEPRIKDLGEFNVRRALPVAGRKMVGPWIFFDHFGPAEFAGGTGMNVRPHPHINLATVTYLFEGEIRHRDSVGSDAIIRPGAINLMVAGRGIVHSERPSPEMTQNYRMEGLQLWHALPEAEEERAPSFHHYPAQDIPTFARAGAEGRVMIGAAFGMESPVATFHPTLYFEASLADGATLDLPEVEELAVYITEGELRVDGELCPFQKLSVLDMEVASRLSAVGRTRFADWNFVSSRKDRIDAAARDWADGAFPLVPGDSEERIPLPDHMRVAMYP